MSKKKKQIKTRDYNMVKLINGATKSGTHVDRKKEANKQEARHKVVREESSCRQCGFPLPEDESKTADHPDFCSFSCEEYYTE